MDKTNSSSSQKTCVICKADVSRAKRTKDSSGRYYCEACVDAVKKRHAAAAQAETYDLDLALAAPTTPRPPLTGQVPAKSAIPQTGETDRGAISSAPNNNISLWWLLILPVVLLLVTVYAILFPETEEQKLAEKRARRASQEQTVSSDTRHSGAEAQAGAEAEKLPTITVNGDADKTLAFGKWSLDATALSTAMTWNGQRAIDTIEYTVRRDGVVKDRGNLWVHGGTLVKGEPTEVTILLSDLLNKNDPVGLSVTIEVQY